MSALSPENGVEVKDTWQQTDLVSSLLLLIILLRISIVVASSTREKHYIIYDYFSILFFCGFFSLQLIKYCNIILGNNDIAA